MWREYKNEDGDMAFIAGHLTLATYNHYYTHTSFWKVICFAVSWTELARQIIIESRSQQVLFGKTRRKYDSGNAYVFCLE